MNKPMDASWMCQWLYLTAGNDDTLHRIAEGFVWTDEWEQKTGGTGSMVCGITGRFSTPGMSGRLSAPRCPECCAGAGVPVGKGNPYNEGIRE